MAKIKGARHSVRILDELAQTIRQAEKQLEDDLLDIRDLSAVRNYNEKVWTVMLAETGIIPREIGAKIIKAIIDYEKNKPEPMLSSYLPSDAFPYTSLEKTLEGCLGPDIAGYVNLGKTLPEPRARLKIRDACIPLFDTMLDFLDTVQAISLKFNKVVMPGYTHMAQGQVTTFGHYLMSMHDPVFRALEELEFGYQRTNLSTMGCGALAGSSWPLDRELVAELLGFEGVLENTNDCVSSIDYCISVFAALANIMITISRLAIDLETWGMEEIGMIRVPESYSSVSSMMPQKKNFGAQLEKARRDSATILGKLQEVAVMTHNEPLADMVPVLRTYRPTVEALCIVKKNLKVIGGFLSIVTPDEKRMDQLSREGFSTASELANTIVRARHISYRQAHHIAGTVVRTAAEQNVKAYQVDAALLDAASEQVLGKPLGFTDAEVHRMLNPKNFVESHNIRGGVAPKEVERMIKQRKTDLEEAKERQILRKEKLSKAVAMLEARINNLIL